MEYLSAEEKQAELRVFSFSDWEENDKSLLRLMDAQIDRKTYFFTHITRAQYLSKYDVIVCYEFWEQNPEYQKVIENNDLGFTYQGIFMNADDKTELELQEFRKSLPPQIIPNKISIIESNLLDLITKDKFRIFDSWVEKSFEYQKKWIGEKLTNNQNPFDTIEYYTKYFKTLIGKLPLEGENTYLWQGPKSIGGVDILSEEYKSLYTINNFKRRAFIKNCNRKFDFLSPNEVRAIVSVKMIEWLEMKRIEIEVQLDHQDGPFDISKDDIKRKYIKLNLEISLDYEIVKKEISEAKRVLKAFNRDVKLLNRPVQDIHDLLVNETSDLFDKREQHLRNKVFKANDLENYNDILFWFETNIWLNNYIIAVCSIYEGEVETTSNVYTQKEVTNKPPKKTKIDILKEELIQYGYYELPKIVALPKQTKDYLTSIMAFEGKDKIAAIVEFTGFYDSLKTHPSGSKSKQSRFKILEQVFESSNDFKLSTIKKHYNSLSKKSADYKSNRYRGAHYLESELPKLYQQLILGKVPN